MEFLSLISNMLFNFLVQMDRGEVHGGQTHDQVARMSMMYNNHYPGGGDHDGMMDMRTRYMQLQKRYQVKDCKQ